MCEISGTARSDVPDLEGKGQEAGMMVAPAVIAPDLSKGEKILYRVDAEPWQIYLLEDGTKLFTKIVLVEAVRMEEYDAIGVPVYLCNTVKLMRTIAPKKLRGTASNPPPISLDVGDYEQPVLVDFDMEGNEEWSLYTFTDGTVARFRVEIARIIRTEKRLPDGDPFYLIMCDAVQRLKVNPQLIKLRRNVPSMVTTGIKGVYG